MNSASACKTISVIVPVLDEAPRLASTLATARLGALELIVVDGGSSDASCAVAAAAGAQVIEGAGRGRALQMNAGAAAARGDVLLFLHADTRLPPGWAAAIVATGVSGTPPATAVNGAVRVPGQTSRTRPPAWGRFDVELDDPSFLLSVVATLMNLRSRLTGICTGDQAIFVSREAWQASGGFAPIPLMEDIELSRRLKRRHGRPVCLHACVQVSARRWRVRGPLRTILGMWLWRLLYFLGASPVWLHARYYGRKQ
jgi:rSAM/selenodomain-associated transferase 2